MEFSVKTRLDFEKKSLLKLHVSQGDNLQRGRTFNFLKVLYFFIVVYNIPHSFGVNVYVCVCVCKINWFVLL